MSHSPDTPSPGLRPLSPRHLAPLLILMLGALVLPAPLPAQESLPILPIDQVERGQTGYGLSVFAGTEPERFEVEVLGVVRNDNPGSSFILARLHGGPDNQPLEQTGVIRGMSGSPVFIDDKLVGAVAFSWAFVEGAVAGITPIEEMRRLHGLPRPEPLSAAVGRPPVPLQQILAGDLPDGLLERQLAALAPAPVQGQTASVQWAAAGLGERTRRLLESAVGGLAPMGSIRGAVSGASPGAESNASLGATAMLPLGTMASASEASTATQTSTAATEPRSPGPSPVSEIRPGDAVAVVLVDGDFKLGPAGTVTDRTGDALVAFGHPFLNAGPVRIPMAEAEVVTVVASQSNSFKVTNVGRLIGAIEQDRDPGIEGRLGIEAPMIPVTVRVHGGEDGGVVGGGTGERDAEFRVRIAAIPNLAAGLLSLTTFNALDVTRYSGGLQGLDLSFRVKLAEHGELHLEQSFDGTTAAGEAVTFLLSTVSYLLQNELERVTVEEIEVDLTQHATPRTTTLVGAHAERSVVRPGQEVALNLDLLPYRGAPYRRSVRVQVPEDVPDGRYYFFVGDGASIDAARLTLEPADPINLRQALRLIRALHSRRQLGVLGFFAGQGLSVAGEVLPQLPGSVASIWGAAPSGSAQPLRLVVAQQSFEQVSNPLAGLVRIDLEVRRREPLSTAGAAKAAGEPGAGDGTQGAGQTSGESGGAGGGAAASAKHGSAKQGPAKDGTANAVGGEDPVEETP